VACRDDHGFIEGRILIPYHKPANDYTEEQLEEYERFLRYQTDLFRTLYNTADSVYLKAPWYRPFRKLRAAFKVFLYGAFFWAAMDIHMDCMNRILDKG